MPAMANGTKPERSKNSTSAFSRRAMALLSEDRTLEVLANVLLSKSSYIDGTANALVAIKSSTGLLCRGFDLCGLSMRSRLIENVRIHHLRNEILGVPIAQGVLENKGPRACRPTHYSCHSTQHRLCQAACTPTL